MASVASLDGCVGTDYNSATISMRLPVSLPCLLLLLLAYCGSAASLRFPTPVQRITPSVNDQVVSRKFNLIAHDVPLHTPFDQPKEKTLDSADLLGYGLAVGSSTLYAPILIKLFQTRDPSGMSASTWVLNVVGTLLALCYPVKQGYPASTYADLAVILAQVTTVLGLICHYNGYLPQFMAAVTVGTAGTAAFLKDKDTSKEVVHGVQLASIAIGAVALLPQIWLTFQTQRSAWSWVTALASMMGCVVRIFTTLRLTKDRTALGGYVLGAVLNGILLGQTLWYGKRSP